jgi:hypothetical protein
MFITKTIDSFMGKFKINKKRKKNKYTSDTGPGSSETCNCKPRHYVGGPG